MPCREHWLQLQRHRQTWQQLGVEIYIVTFDDTELARAYAEKHAESETGQVPFREWPQAIKGHFVTRHPPLPDTDG